MQCTQCFFRDFFRRFHRLTRHTKIFELGQKSGELDLEFYQKSSLTKKEDLKVVLKT